MKTVIILILIYGAISTLARGIVILKDKRRIRRNEKFLKKWPPRPKTKN